MSRIMTIGGSRSRSWMVLLICEEALVECRERSRKGEEVRQSEACGPPPVPLALDRVQGDRAGLAVRARTHLIRQALCGLGMVAAVPLDCAILEAQGVAARFRLDRAKALVLVERLDGSEELHEIDPSFPNGRNWPLAAREASRRES